MAPRIVLNREAAKGFTRYRVPAEMRVDGATANPTPQIIGVVDDGAEGPVAYVRADELMNWVPDSALGSGNFGPGLQILMAPHRLSDTEFHGDPRWRRRQWNSGPVQCQQVNFQ